jgi:hypothetical protein
VKLELIAAFAASAVLGGALVGGAGAVVNRDRPPLTFSQWHQEPGAESPTLRARVRCPDRSPYIQSWSTHVGTEATDWVRMRSHHPLGFASGPRPLKPRGWLFSFRDVDPTDSRSRSFAIYYTCDDE